MDKQTEQILEKITTGRRLLLKDYPEFGMTSLNLKIILDENCDVGWTDGIHIGFNPTWVIQAPKEHLIFLWGHECLHVMLLHPFRIGNRDRELFNIAGDYVINSMLTTHGISPIPDCLYDYDYRGKTTEEVYYLLDYKKKKEEKDKGNHGGGNRDARQKMIGEVRPVPGTPDEVKKTEQEQKIRNTISIQASKQWGSLSKELLRQIGILTEPKVSWQTILRNYMDNLTRDDYSWRRLDPMYMDMELLVPTLWDETISEIAVFADSSGSINNEDLDQFNAEFNACLSILPDTIVHYISCDSKNRVVGNYHSKEGYIKLEVKGGGGTDFRPPFAMVEERDWNPKVVIYLTDLECDRFPKEPDYPVLWVQVRNSPHAQKPPFGDVIQIY